MIINVRIILPSDHTNVPLYNYWQGLGKTVNLFQVLPYVKRVEKGRSSMKDLL